ncbi:hypothetical protein [Micromonospora sp. NBC_01796]|uniref:hypothetical protein n=1 Tax=Micromonospora sp. NBC_01796 TaxID=2975987 RepID=UPI002DDB7B9B|nr:hypothetical protein [Micromonospora sp. NBC_01796]WSA84634.1 hypothetical protein OIE47_30400 [Micromonospora sp. NBC_01796]
MATQGEFQRFLNRIQRGLNLPRGFNADGRTLGLGLALALESQRRATRPTDEEIARLLNEHTEDDLVKL